MVLLDLQKAFGTVDRHIMQQIEMKVDPQHEISNNDVCATSKAQTSLRIRTV